MSYVQPDNMDDMDDCEIVAALMRGQFSECKQGYSARNAVYAVKRLRPDADEIWLRFFAAGYAAGMRVDDTMPGADDMPLGGSDDLPEYKFLHQVDPVFRAEHGPVSD